jgi:hypothetical protein
MSSVEAILEKWFPDTSQSCPECGGCGYVTDSNPARDAKETQPFIDDLRKIARQADILIILKPEFADSYRRQFEEAAAELKTQMQAAIENLNMTTSELPSSPPAQRTFVSISDDEHSTLRIEVTHYENTGIWDEPVSRKPIRPPTNRQLAEAFIHFASRLLQHPFKPLANLNQTPSASPLPPSQAPLPPANSSPPPP